jgi:putative ABC transport system permease protein
MALGASSASVMRMVLVQGGRLAAIGGGVGLLLAGAAGLLVQSLLLGVPALDPVSFVLAAAVLSSVPLLATWLPARRAARMDPMQALRIE